VVVPIYNAAGADQSRQMGIASDLDKCVQYGRNQGENTLIPVLQGTIYDEKQLFIWQPGYVEINFVSY